VLPGFNLELDTSEVFNGDFHIASLRSSRKDGRRAQDRGWRRLVFCIP
jgi:hypothetical protein